MGIDISKISLIEEKNRIEDGSIIGKTFMASVKVGDALFFSSWINNGLYKMNLLTGESEFLCFICDGEINAGAYGDAIYYDESIWLLPARANSIVRIDLKTLSMEKLVLPIVEEDRINRNCSKFHCCYREGERYIWLVPFGYPLFLRVDLQECRIEIVNTEWPGSKWNKRIVNFSDACIVDDEIWICPCDYKDILIYNVVTNNIEVMPYKADWTKYGKVKKYKDWIIFFPIMMDENIIMIHRKRHEKKNISLKSYKIFGSYYAIEIIEDYAILAPFINGIYFNVNLDNGTISINEEIHNTFVARQNDNERYYNSFIDGNRVYFVSDRAENPMFVYDVKNSIGEFINVFCKSKLYKKKFNELVRNDKVLIRSIFFDKNDAIIENDIPLENYFDLIEANEERMDKTFFGDKIWHYLDKGEING